jgi:hypothetical protein
MANEVKVKTVCIIHWIKIFFHIFPEKREEPDFLGGVLITSFSAFSVHKAKAGRESVTKFIHKIIMAVKKGICKKTVTINKDKTSAIFADKRYCTDFCMLL